MGLMDKIDNVSGSNIIKNVLHRRSGNMLVTSAGQCRTFNQKVLDCEWSMTSRTVLCAKNSDACYSLPQCIFATFKRSVVNWCLFNARDAILSVTGSMHSLYCYSSYVFVACFQ